jgi:iron complex outermembrane receptor protein
VDDSDYTRIPSYGVLNLYRIERQTGKPHLARLAMAAKRAQQINYRVIKAGDYGSAYGQLADERLWRYRWLGL